jgi:hypothetical protein
MDGFPRDMKQVYNFESKVGLEPTGLPLRHASNNILEQNFC